VQFPFSAPSRDGIRIGRALFLGPSGSGKTRIAAAFIRTLGWPKPYIRCVAPPTKTKLANSLGVPHIGLSITDREGQERTFSKIFAEVTKPYEQGGHDIGFALDDADFYFSQAGRTYGSSALSELVKLGREAGLSQVIVAQGSASISKDLISNSNCVLYARTSEPNLTDYAQRYMQDLDEADRVIRNLPEHVFMAYFPNAENKFPGLCWLNPNTEQIECRDLSPPEESPTSTDEEEAPTPDDTADSADGESPTANGPTDAPTANAPEGTRTVANGMPRTESGKPPGRERS
jgi:hypothetical protein